MSQPKVSEKTPLSLSELKEEVEKIQKRDGELGFRAGKTQEYVNSLDIIPKEDYVKLKEEIEGLEIPRLKEEHIVKIIDFLPRSTEDLEVILQGYPLTISKENMEKIVGVTKPARNSK